MTGKTAPVLAALLDPIREDLQRVESELARMTSSHSTPMRALVSHVSRFSGKRLRPALTLIAAVKKGFFVAIISGGRSRSMVNRFRMLNIQHVFLGVEHKLDTLKSFMETNDLKPEEVLYMGDDIPDFHPMKYCWVAACPADAAEEITPVSHYISHLRGGEGCARDVIEQVMKVQGLWMDGDAFSW